MSVQDDAKAGLRASAVDASAKEAPPERKCFCSLQDIWRELMRGDWKIVDAFTDDSRCYLVLTAPPERPDVGLLSLEILERLLRGDAQKNVAFDLGLSCSTIATIAKQALSRLGLNCLPSRVPMALVVAAQASENGQTCPAARIDAFQYADFEHHVVSARRPDSNLATLLPPGEVEVMRARIEGCTHQKIAGLRQTSKRTIANQIASASRRLGASGRLEIIGRLALPSPSSNNAGR